jgi:hypothetical protein
MAAEMRGEFAMNLIEITDFHAPELDVYARLTEAQLLNRFEPKKGMFIAESPKVIMRALDAGCQPVSLLVERNHIIRQTFENAKASGDKNVYFIDGRELLLPTALEYSLVDNTHPTDMGFFGMYTRMLPLMRTLIK